MKLNRTYLFIVLSSLALIAVLIIQVNWIVQTANIKEELFAEKANMVLSRTTEDIGSDTETCRNINDAVDQTGASHITRLGNNEVRKIDSLFNHYMRFYNFHVDYTFEVAKPGAPTVFSNTYYKPLEHMSGKNKLQLKLVFPDKKQFIIAEMGTLFITSVLLILIVLILFWRTLLSLLKEKEISEHTADFLNNMTHELRTPLTNIALAGKMMLKETTLQQEDKVKHYSAIILDENEKLRIQVEHVLSMTALERGEIPIRKTVLDIHALLHTALKQFAIQLEHKQGIVRLNLHAAQYMVAADQTHLLNTFCNLLDNALKYTHNTPELSIETSDAGAHIRIVISDNGIGISNEYREKVFAKFFRVPTGDVHDVKGFGLGLAYVKKIVELHEGTLQLESEKGQGTQFTITLPHA
ncbi:MAG: HAMP domain-containing sensor histidine kinase [Bacteroidota bacterium]